MIRKFKRSFQSQGLYGANDTVRPSGDFLIDYHPDHDGLFLATGDSGHGVKVLPVIGEKIMDAIDGKLDHILRDLWRWREDVPATFKGTSDGTRGGRRGMMFREEWQRPADWTRVGRVHL